MKTLKTTIATVLGILIIFVTADLSKAQNFRQSSPVDWGVTAGVSIADMWGDDVGGTSAQAGFTGGLFLNYRTHPLFSIQPEMLFSMKNSEVSTGVHGESGTTEYEFGYLEIPVLLKGHIPTNGAIRPNLYVGPSLAFKLYGDANGDDLDDDLKSTDFGFAFGAGIDIYQRINLDARYTLGIVDIFDVPGDPSAKNGVFNITLGYGF